ncbi:MAG TPA: aldehyde dehydrogenase family protein [Mycobacteriales bacterium]|nr:aldehyde dehydrogenase family protein [Mycobacteriales bacterium]
MTAVIEAPDVAFLREPRKQLLIGGGWVDAQSGRAFATHNPSNGQVIAELAEAGTADVDRAVAAARAAFAGPWRTMRPAQRQNLLWAVADALEAHYEELRLLEVLEMGSPIGKRRPGKKAAAWEATVLRYFAGWATKLHGKTIPNSLPGNVFSYTLKEPVGVVGAIVPWNRPISNAIWKIAPVLATGCTMILKPAEEASLAALRIGELLLEAGVPDGVVNVVTGGAEAGAALAGHLDVDKVAFTGSTVTGQHIIRAAAGNLKRVSLELGGKSPDVVFADADLDKAVPGAAMSVFSNSGQICCAGTRIYVEEPVYEEFVAGVSDFAGTLTVGNALDPETTIGPLVSAEQLERVTGYLELGPREGVRTTAGGARLTDGDLADGYFVPPTVFADVRDDMRVAQEEIFGPVACVMPFSSMEEVAARSNETTFGLAAGMWTRDVGKAHRLAAAMQAGTVWINTALLFDPAVPFGGYKMSGWGHEMGEDCLDEYLNTKSVWIDTT